MNTTTLHCAFNINNQSVRRRSITGDIKIVSTENDKLSLLLTEKYINYSNLKLRDELLIIVINFKRLVMNWCYKTIKF